jgi:hypothetical protein
MESASVVNKGRGNATVANYGGMNSINTQTYQAHTEVGNFGGLGSLYAKDQNDDTHIFNSGNIGDATLVANGARGYINLQNQGGIESLYADANYGGVIDINNLFGDVGTFNADASGASHGQRSQINILS